MTRIKNTYKEPLVISLLAETHGRSSRNRFQMQLLVGEEIEVADSSVSPEVLLLAKKNRVSLAVSDESVKEDIVEPEEDHVKEATEAVKEDSAAEDSSEEELVKALEEELLQ